MKKLIIICEEKLLRYGDFLSQLISAADDRTGKVIGIKEGDIVARVFSEKEYTANSSTISSDQYLLFIGDSKLIKEKRHHMLKQFTEHGMNYGWLGRQAVLFVDRPLKFSEYEPFFQLAMAKVNESHQPELQRLLPAKLSPIYDDLTSREEPVVDEDTETKLSDEYGPEITEGNIGADELEEHLPVTFDDNDENDEIEETNNHVAEGYDRSDEKNGDKEPAPAKKEIKIMQRIRSPFKDTKIKLKKSAYQGKRAVNNLVGNIAATTKKQDLEEQQYSCLVMLFYWNGLGDFLGINEV